MVTYVNGTAVKQVRGANAIADAMSTTMVKQRNPDISDSQLRLLIAAHIDDDRFLKGGRESKQTNKPPMKRFVKCFLSFDDNFLSTARNRAGRKGARRTCGRIEAVFSGR